MAHIAFLGAPFFSSPDLEGTVAMNKFSGYREDYCALLSSSLWTGTRFLLLSGAFNIF